MRATLRILPAALVALLLLLAVACGVGDDEKKSSGDQTSDQTGGQTDGDTSQPIVSNAIEALGMSADRFEQDISSMRAEFSFNMNVSGMSMGATGDFLYESPDKMYMLMKLASDESSLIDLGQLGNFEILLRGEDLYMNTAFTGWVSTSLDELGEDGKQFEELLSGHSPFDYQELIDSLGADVQDLGQESLDGQTYSHYRVSMDLAKVIDAISDSLGSTDSLGTEPLPADFSGPITMDIWVDPDTLLPYQLTADGSFGTGTESADFAMAMKFLEYNGSVTIPEPPQDAQSLSDLAEAFGGDGSEGGFSFGE